MNNQIGNLFAVSDHCREGLKKIFIFMEFSADGGEGVPQPVKIFNSYPKNKTPTNGSKLSET